MSTCDQTVEDAVRAFEEAHDLHNVRVTFPPGSDWLVYTCLDCDASIRIGARGLELLTT